MRSYRILCPCNFSDMSSNFDFNLPSIYRLLRFMIRSNIGYTRCKRHLFQWTQLNAHYLAMFYDKTIPGSFSSLHGYQYVTLCTRVWNRAYFTSPVNRGHTSQISGVLFVITLFFYNRLINS